MKKVAITGATGFIGAQICKSFDKSNIDYVRLTRTPICDKDRFYDLSSKKINKDLLKGVDILIHAAAFVHKGFDVNMHKKLNFHASKLIFDLAFENNINIIFLSTVGVYGHISSKGKIEESHKLDPLNIYSETKLSCEEYLQQKALFLGKKYTILRLPLVIGKNAPGSFGQLEKLVLSGIPLPFKSVKNSRSVLCVKRLGELIVNFCLNKDFLNSSLIVKNKNDMSLEEMCEFISQIHNCKLRIFYFPVSILRIILLILGKKKIEHQLLRSLVFNSSLEI
tara:strand:- start:1106 stop:1945 length:840 start_codon:yes stop_codon:yes gene_type:complete